MALHEKKQEADDIAHKLIQTQTMQMLYCFWQIFNGRSQLCEIYRRMCKVFEAAGFRKKLFSNRLNMSLPQCAWVEKTDHGVETHWLSGK